MSAKQNSGQGCSDACLEAFEFLKFSSLLCLHANRLTVSQTQQEGMGEVSTVHFNGSPVPVSRQVWAITKLLPHQGKEAENKAK